MVKLRKNKLKQLNKSPRKPDANSQTLSNKIIKKKLNAEKRVSFHKQILLQQALGDRAEPALVESVSTARVKRKPASVRKVKIAEEPKETVKKIKPIQKQKQRQSTSINDAKLLMKLMKSK